MNLLKTLQGILTLLFFLVVSYQLLFLFLPHLKKAKTPTAHGGTNRYAILICARNEEAVITQLIRALRRQTYPAGQIRVFVMADNCTDETAACARAAGAVVYERTDTEKVGKGYALDALLQHIDTAYPEGFDGYAVFDADNLPAPDCLAEMDRMLSDGWEIVTGYRTAGNFGDNWISAGYGLWFLRESRYMNLPRMLCGSSAVVAGTGFVFSRRVLREMGGWPFHLLSEDTEFTAWHVLRGYRIGTAPDAVFYDEQPTEFRQSFRQRVRWIRGYLQVLRRYGGDLMRGILRGSFACYDLCVANGGTLVYTALNLLLMLILAVWQIVRGETAAALFGIGSTIVSILVSFLLLGAYIMITERKRIALTRRQRILYTLTFPLFMTTWIPVSIAALLPGKAEWHPIRHKGTIPSVTK